ncbi:carboxypeptidase regulatory-like domain-containing protein [Candidatus Fermentibacteria bacterium]|nr:carboxypeptidase regulatory-like domain-containing protein [Candidatus Fermentibacteria bacterium]
MRRFTVLSPICMLLLVAVSNAAESPDIRLVDPLVGAAEPAFIVLEATSASLRLEMRLPSLQQEQLAIEGEIFQALTIPGGDIRGEVGHPGLPVITRLVAIPSNVGVSVNVLERESMVLSGFRLLPVQPDEGEELVIDREAYAQRPGPAAPAAEAGAPALLHSLRVVPLTFNPVAYDPVVGEVTITTRVEVEVQFGGQDSRNAAPLQRKRIPDSFHRMYQDVVLNYDLSMGRGDADVGPGTYLVIHSSASGVLTAVQPLIDWRTRQGYTVLTASTTQTGTTTTSIKNYIQNIYNAADPPLEFVTIVGDADGTYGVATGSYSGGEGDHSYTMLEGSDYLADVHIGRLSHTGLTNLQAIVTKIMTYETTPPTGDSGWFTRACLLGDPSSSGITCIYINQWLKKQLLGAGYTQVDTIFSSPWVSQMTASVNQGLSVFGYRGYLGMSGITTTTIGGLTNGYELPLAIIPTCGSGDFAGETCNSEAFLRNANGGGIGSVGTATWSTHTRYNNCYYAGTWDGAVNGSDHRLGTAHSRGKLNLYLNYQYDGDVAQRFSVWNNLMGDPATDMWTAHPAVLSVTYPSLLAVGANSVPVTITAGTLPVAGALVTIYKADGIHGSGSLVSGYSDFSGRVNLPVSATAGQALVTVTKHNCFPHLGQIVFGSMESFAGYEGCIVDDDASGASSGNGNGIVNPAEIIELPVSLHNHGTSAVTGVIATLSTSDPYVTITDAEETFGTIGAGATVWSAEDFDFGVAPTIPDGHVLALDLTAHSGASVWTSLIELTVQSAAFEVEDFTWGGGGTTLDPGESGTLSIRIGNVGSIDGVSVTGELSTDSPWIDVTDGAGGWGTIAAGGSNENTANPFALSIASDCVKGHKAHFTLTLTFNGQAQDVVEFTSTVGAATTVDPTGPDVYGYYAFDNTDVGYFYAPTYAWVELDPTYGGPGTDVGLTDFGYEQDDTKIRALPFVFRFYGQDYSQISICSNGWVVMGQTYQKPYTNTTLPSAGAPEAAICPMWDDLYQSGTNRVYYWNDTANHRYGIQWSRMKNDYSNATQNFQVFLYDPSCYPTPTGDGEILFQYQTVNNTDSRDGYVTVGIQNQDHTDGLLYTYWNHYSPGAASLGTGRAIRILPIGTLHLGTLQGDVTNASAGGAPVQEVTIRLLETNQTLASNSSGHYTGSVEEGMYTVRAEHLSFAPETVPNVVITEGETTELDFALTDILGPQISNTTVLLTTDDTVGPYVVEATITDFTSLSGAHLYFKVNGGPAVDVPLTLINAATGLHRGQIPGQPLNTSISYWVEATDGVANESRDPSGTDTYDFWVLASVEILHHDMESDQGWTVGAAGDNATSGIWVRVDPNGVWSGSIEVQPENDATADPGVMCYVTGNDPPGSTQGADDVDNGTTTVLSPWLDLSPYAGVTLTYRRWYTNDTGSSPGLDYWVVQATDDGATWVDLERTNVSDRSWALQTFVLDTYVELSSTVRLRFIASDVSPGSIVEAGLDEVTLTGYAPTAMTLSGGVEENQLVLTWTSRPDAASYWVHGADNDAYFTPALGNRLATVPATTTTWSTSTGLGDPDHNWTYMVRAMDASEQELIHSGRFGEHEQLIDHP